jgi:hypothetical protein
MADEEIAISDGNPVLFLYLLHKLLPFCFRGGWTEIGTPKDVRASVIPLRQPIAARTRYGHARAVPVNLQMKTESERAG